MHFNYEKTNIQTQFFIQYFLSSSNASYNAENDYQTNNVKNLF